MPRRPDVYLDIALRALRRVPKFLNSRPLPEYLSDELCQSAVERQLEIAGDALGQLRKLNAGLFQQIPDGDLVVGFRNWHTATPHWITAASTRLHRHGSPNYCRRWKRYWLRFRSRRQMNPSGLSLQRPAISDTNFTWDRCSVRPR